MASPFSGPRRRTPCLRTQPATSLLRLFQQGPCPRPPAPRRPSPPAQPSLLLLPPSPPRCPPAARGAPVAARLGLKCVWSSSPSQPGAQACPLPRYPLPCFPLGAPPLPAPQHPAAPSLASRPTPGAPPWSAKTTVPPDRQAAIVAPHRAPGRRAEERRGLGAMRAVQGGSRGPAGELGRRGGGAHPAPRARAPLRQRRPCPRPCLRGGRGLARGPQEHQGPSAKRAGPVPLRGADPQKPWRRKGLRQPRPRPAHQVSPRSPTPPTVPYPGSPVILASPPQNASQGKRGLGQQPESAGPGLKWARRRKAGSRLRSTNDWVTLASSLKLSPPCPGTAGFSPVKSGKWGESCPGSAAK